MIPFIVVIVGIPITFQRLLVPYALFCKSLHCGMRAVRRIPLLRSEQIRQNAFCFSLHAPAVIVRIQPALLLRRDSCDICLIVICGYSRHQVRDHAFIESCRIIAELISELLPFNPVRRHEISR